MAKEFTGLSNLDDLEKKVEELPDSTHKTLLEYEIKNIRLDLRNIEE